MKAEEKFKVYGKKKSIWGVWSAAFHCSLFIFIFPAVEVMGWAWSGGWFAGSVQQCGGWGAGGRRRHSRRIDQNTGSAHHKALMHFISLSDSIKWHLMQVISDGCHENLGCACLTVKHFTMFVIVRNYIALRIVCKWVLEDSLIYSLISPYHPCS